MSKNDLLFYLALIFAIWFLFTGIFWVYWIALFIAYPAGIIALILWTKIKKDKKQRNKVIPLILIIACLLSIGILVYALLTN